MTFETQSEYGEGYIYEGLQNVVNVNHLSLSN